MPRGGSVTWLVRATIIIGLTRGVYNFIYKELKDIIWVVFLWHYYSYACHGTDCAAAVTLFVVLYLSNARLS